MIIKFFLKRSIFGRHLCNALTVMIEFEVNTSLIGYLDYECGEVPSVKSTIRRYYGEIVLKCFDMY